MHQDFTFIICIIHMPYHFFIDPFMLTHQQVDKGAIRFVLSGANIMCPGLTSPGAKMIDAEKDKIVVSFLYI